MSAERKEENKVTNITEQQGAEDTAPKATVDDTDDDDNLIIKFKKPYKFEGKEYTELDLTALEDLTAQDMIDVERKLNRSSAGINVMPEVTDEYALEMAARAAKLPIEFFYQLPQRESIRVKNRYMAFLFGSE